LKAIYKTHKPILLQCVIPGGSGGLMAEMQADESEEISSQLRTMRSLVARLTSLQVDPTEFACLKAIVLFKPGK
jgi:Ligand-binding domain of nuclear hormone receptor